ncbi:MAG: L,D-transpeptidase family protein [Desulfobacteraceae bacterium]|jgi:L,D-transpeptidase ErfK/SrfK
MNNNYASFIYQSSKFGQVIKFILALILISTIVFDLNPCFFGENLKNAYALRGAAFPYRFPGNGQVNDPEAKTVIGFITHHKIKKGQTLLDIAKEYGLGYNEMADLYPDIDPWIPPVGQKLVIPSQWVLPDVTDTGIVVNVAELRLYYFIHGRLAKTYPVGIGDMDWVTPTGTYNIGLKQINPVWHVPSSLREKYGVTTMPAGPENPLGAYWMGLGDSHYGIHGTPMPWSIGRPATHGCIRLYDEDIKSLYRTVPSGTGVKIIYEPVKFGMLNGKLYTEIHPDIYNRIDNFEAFGWKQLEENGLKGKVNLFRFKMALKQKNGLPVDITQNTLFLNTRK